MADRLGETTSGNHSCLDDLAQLQLSVCTNLLLPHSVLVTFLDGSPAGGKLLHNLSRSDVELEMLMSTNNLCERIMSKI